MNIELTNDGKKGKFMALENNVHAGEMTFTWAGDQKFIIDHTEVNPDFRGQSVGKQLVMAAVQFARERDVKIIPLCPYAKSVFQKSEDIRDILA